MKRIGWWIGSILLTVVLATAAQRSVLKETLPDSEFRKMGLHKLTTSELEALEKFIVELVRYPVSQPPSTPLRPNISSMDFSNLDGRTVIMAQDDERTFLGKISSNKFDSKSIINEYGFGNPYRSDSIMNSYGRFGGEYSQYSPFNPFASKPPKVYEGDRFVGYLSKNTALSPRIDPDALLGYLKSKAL
jgi:hypothetical protein